ncbi:MAG: response regulator [Massilibacteroides sp.]|nr:response regulator [Massilibacteroides sp.]MDD3061881.1 response regulator [Massilibacteroides sp.]MDD4114671.1 response regulator [Massilibacteroides sp.]
MRDGLSQNNINSLIVDSTGYVWMGTIEGITRFDGSKFSILRSVSSDSNTLEGNYIEKLSSCPNGNIWIHVQDRGLNLYETSKESFRIFDDSCFYPADVVHTTSLVSPLDSILWFTDPNGLYTYNLQDNKTTLLKSPPGKNHIIYAGNNKVLLWGYEGIYLYSLSDPLKSPKKIMDHQVQKMSQVFSDSLVIIRTDSLEIFNIKTAEREKLPYNALLNSYTKDGGLWELAGYNNEIWLGLQTCLIQIIMDGDKIHRVSKHSYDPFNEYSFHGQDAKKFAFDKSGNLWIGTSKYGVNLYSRKKNIFSHHPISIRLKPDQEIDPIRAICKTSNGDIWVGFDRVGLIRISSENQQVIYSKIYYPGNVSKNLENIRSIYEDSNGMLWIGSNKGLCNYNPVNNHIESTLVKYGWEWKDVCYRMHEFHVGKLTVTNQFGIGVIDLISGELKNIQMPENYITGSIRSITKDKKSNYWFVSGDLGMCKLTPRGELTYYTYKKDNFTDSKLYSLEIVGDTMWIGSNTGLMAFDLNKEKVVSRFFEVDGLSNNIIYSIVYVNDELWMSTNRGLSRLHLRDFSIEKYLTDHHFMDDAFFYNSTGKIYFGGYDGFISFIPEEIPNNTLPSNPIITDLYLNNHKIKVGERIKGRTILANSINELKTLKLDYSQSSFSLVFDAFPFSYPDQTIFRYRLIGQSNDWILVPLQSNQAVFSSLQPDDYIFEVEASENGRDWSLPKQLSLSIVPPFYKTTWFNTILISFILISLYIIQRIRVYTIKRWNVQLEQKIKEQTSSIEEQKNKIISQKEKMIVLNKCLHEADQAKLNYYTNLSHEFRTPLTIIMGNVETLKEHGVNKFILKNIQRSSDRLYRLVDQFVDLNKYDHGELKLQVSNFNIVSFTKEIVETFNDYAQRKKIDINVLKAEENIPLWLDRDKTDKIIYNILTNAIKYTNEGGAVFVDFEKKNDGVVIKITDTGIGISEEEQKNIFNRFFRSKKIETYIDGHGMGLTLVKALVDIQKGNISCSSKEGVGTSFNIFFRTGKDHFKSSDFISEKEIQKINRSEKPATTTIDHGIPSGDKILLVEDNPELLEYLSSLLGKYYRIWSATNGKEALKVIKESIPQLIITDLMMPIMDGIELSKTIRKMRETRFIPIIILSAKTDISSKIDGFKTNIDDYIEKPFDPNLLLSRVKNLLYKYSEIKKDAEQFIITKNNSWHKDDKELFNKLLIILADNYSNPEFNSDVLSNMIGMSRVTFYRKMKKLDQDNPGEFIRKYRLKKAAELIKAGGKPISEICTDVGFQSLPHFRKCFKDEFGIMPSKYLG